MKISIYLPRRALSPYQLYFPTSTTIPEESRVHQTPHTQSLRKDHSSDIPSPHSESWVFPLEVQVFWYPFLDQGLLTEYWWSRWELVSTYAEDRGIAALGILGPLFWCPQEASMTWGKFSDLCLHVTVGSHPSYQLTSRNMSGGFLQESGLLSS